MGVTVSMPVPVLVTVLVAMAALIGGMTMVPVVVSAHQKPKELRQQFCTNRSRVRDIGRWTLIAAVAIRQPGIFQFLPG